MILPQLEENSQQQNNETQYTLADNYNISTPCCQNSEMDNGNAYFDHNQQANYEGNFNNFSSAAAASSSCYSSASAETLKPNNSYTINQGIAQSQSYADDSSADLNYLAQQQYSAYAPSAAAMTMPNYELQRQTAGFHDYHSQLGTMPSAQFKEESHVLSMGMSRTMNQAAVAPPSPYANSMQMQLSQASDNNSDYSYYQPNADYANQQQEPPIQSVYSADFKPPCGAGNNFNHSPMTEMSMSMPSGLEGASTGFYPASNFGNMAAAGQVYELEQNSATQAQYYPMNQTYQGNDLVYSQQHA
ncbi:uncharacterized protein LOC108599899 isoform X1 [Drosophila busckii]|uniref:uncharacterized protein LOC108599899 isoform X1 n=1 Tax=Drosophila busckii TaxID=30019 RepID=UPI001432B148|nr:uncharacterized protein LOC108599899 isoform X1 [Drosophila busckii]